MTAHKFVCPWWLCFTFDNALRKLLHDPEAILAPHIRPGSNVVDLGAGMGYFSIPMAKLVGAMGHVTAIDIQTKMLSVLARRAQRQGVSKRITTHLANPDSLDYYSRADFVLAFWMVHEVPDQRKLLTEVHALLKPDGLFLLAEPMLHVREKDFLETLRTAEGVGFFIKEKPKIRICHTALLAPAEKIH